MNNIRHVTRADPIARTQPPAITPRSFALESSAEGEASLVESITRGVFLWIGFFSSLSRAPGVLGFDQPPGASPRFPKKPVASAMRLIELGRTTLGNLLSSAVASAG